MSKPLSEVTDTEVRVALEEQNNARILRTMTKKFRSSLSRDEVYSCALVAIWKTLSRHDNSFGQAFSTSFYRFLKWECLRIISRWKVNEWAKASEPTEEMLGSRPDPAHTPERLQYVFDCMQHLPTLEAKVVRAYYVEGLTIEEIASRHSMGKETARQRLEHALGRLKELCLDPDLGCNNGLFV